MKTYINGGSYKDDGATYRTYGINEKTSANEHGFKIVVYGDKKLRKRIIKLLNEYEWKNDAF